MALKLTIVTPSFNQGRFLEETILSVLNQGYAPLEYMVIDGGSSDETVSIIRRYEHRLAYWVSEKDRGQVHAINKGLERATGDVFAFLNSDDVYLPGVFNAVIRHFNENPLSEWVCGDTIMFGEGHDTQVIRANVPLSAAHCLSWAYRAAQPGHFWRTDLVRSGFQERWNYDFDHDMYVRLLLAGHKCEYLPLPMAGYRLHEVSKTIAEGHRQLEEFDQIAEFYEPQLQGVDQRWCRATRFLRLSYAASEAGRKSEAASWLIRALATHPEGVLNRPFWGCLRRLAVSRSTDYADESV
jgi:glycosyltransferase involved in cell wall biosynthesis